MMYVIYVPCGYLTGLSRPKYTATTASSSGLGKLVG